jgi:hydroxymethylpyrimidine kinase/phosphomethylpyrimidine kinase
MPPPVVLTIAGFDPSSGAGITADLKTFAAHGCYGLACITVLTVQSTRGVKCVEPLPGKLVSETLAELKHDFEIHAVKIGMLGSAAVARAVLRFLQKNRLDHVVLDPVMRSSSGAALLDKQGINVLRKMLPLAEVITPNTAEAAALVSTRIREFEDLKSAARRLQQLGARSVVITGGDFDAAPGEAVDVFSSVSGEYWEFRAPKIASRNTHGTGCAFSSAIAANLAAGKSLRESVATAKGYVAEAIRTAPELGKGKGPLNHFTGVRLRHGN